MMVEHLALRGDCAASETYEVKTLSHMDRIKSQWEGRNLKQGVKPSLALTEYEKVAQNSAVSGSPS